MNRAERRKADKLRTKTEFTTEHKNTITYVKYSNMLEQAKEDAMREASKVITAIMAVSLNDEYGFSTKRTNKLIERIKSQLECIISGHVEPEDIIDWCAEKQIKLL